mgnify:CR=1 FL=1
MSLVYELIKDLLPEQEKKKVVAVYGGGFKPPTKGHFEVVQQALKQNPEIDKFIINIGGRERDGVTPEESIMIWDIYKQYLPLKVEIQASTTPPIKATYDYAKSNPNEEVLFILGAREGNEDDFSDIAKRTKALDNYPNLQLRTIVTQGGASGTAARQAGKISKEKLVPYLPDELKDEEVDEVYRMISDKVTEGRKPKKDPKKGTGKKPKGSGRRLYTDEDPKDTVGIKFSTRQDIVDTLNKKSFKAKSHARQSQIINLIHQRVRAALGRTKDPKKRAKLQSGFKYIKKRKEASKAKTQRLKKKKLNEKKGYGKSAGYRYRAIYKKDGKFYFMQDNPFSPGIRQEFGPYKTKEAAKRKMQSFPPGTSYRDLTEEELNEKLCKRGKDYIAKRKRQGEKHNPFLAARAVKVCKGQMSGTDGKQKKDFRPKKGKTRSAQGRKPDIVKEIGIDLSNYSGQVLPGDVLRAPKGFPLGGKKLESSKQLKVIKNSREGVNRYKLSLEDSDGKKYTVRNFQMDGEYKGKKLPKWGMVRKSKKNLNEQLDSKKFDFRPYIASLTKYFMDNEMALEPLPKIELIHNDIENGMDVLGKTAYYVPATNDIVLFTYGRHPKDILRSYAHELVHVHQKNENRLEDYGTTNVNQDDHLEQIEREAYETGNILFRSWTDSLNKKQLKELLTEGKYDSLVTKLAGFTLNAWKGDYNEKQRKGYFEVEVGPGKDYDYPFLDFTYKAQAIFDNNVKYKDSGVAKPFVPEVEIKFLINGTELPEKWEEISMDLRNIIRHEISHLMQAGPNVKAGKEMKSDQDKRKELESGKKPWWKIWRKKLGTPDYYKLEKEIDANLEGLYLKAKKSRQPLGKVIDDYLEFKLKLSPKDREDIKNLWRERAPKINIPLFEGKKKDPFGLNAYAMELARGLEEQESEYKVYLDMDGVVADFDKRFEDLSGMKPREFEEKYGKSKFWDFIDEENKISFWVGIPEMDGAKKLVDYVKKYNYELLTAPSVKKQSYLGKILWVRNHSDLLGGKPRINFKKAKEKHEVKSELTKNDILIDDRADTISRWEAKGGTGIVYSSADQVINDLKKLGL